MIHPNYMALHDLITVNNQVSQWLSGPKARLCGRSVAGNVGSNPAWSVDVCLSRVLCILSGRCQADSLSTAVLPTVVSKWMWLQKPQFEDA